MSTYPDLTPTRRRSLCVLLGEISRLKRYAEANAPRYVQAVESLGRAVNRQFPECRTDADRKDPDGVRNNAELRASLRTLVQDVAADARESVEVVAGEVRGR